MNDNEYIIEKYKKYEPFFSNWYLKRFVGEGGFAKVFEIVRSDFGNEYVSAMKIITVSKTKSEINSMRSEGMTDGEIREYLRGIVEDTVREIRLMYKLKGNGNIVGYEDHAVMEHEDGMGWDILIKMEYLTSLSDYIQQRKGQIAKRDVLKLGIDICKALELCQKYNIIHRDIKADNIFVSENGEFKLGDFGIARVIERKDTELSKKGTSAYMAPEVYKGQTYTSAVDIYSLGIVLYRLLNNNRAPFLPAYPKPMSLDDRDRALMMRMSGEKFPKPSQAGKSRLTEIILKACAYRPQERYSSPGFMRQELEALLINQDEVTMEEMIMIYEEGRRDTTSSRQSIPIVQQSKESALEDIAKEVHRQDAVTEDDATEILRSEATEVLRADDATEVLRPQAAWPDTASQSVTSGAATDVPVQRVPAPADRQEAKVLCKSCGGVIDHNMTFCPICGANQDEEAEAPHRHKKSVFDKLQALWKTKKALVIGGVCAAVLATAVIIGVSGTSGSPEKQEIITITFLDTLDDMPKSAWSAPEFGSGEVMAWAVKRDGGGYDLYIGAEGGVVANESCHGLFSSEYYNVEQIHINGNFDTSNVTDMEAMFSFCESLTSVDVSGFDTSNVTNMASMFYYCKSLTSVDVSGFDTSKVTDMGWMFDGCRSLTSVDVSGFDTSKVTNMRWMFNECRSLTSVDVSGFDTSNVTNMRSMFRDCASLTNLDVSNFSPQQVAEMEIPLSVTVTQTFAPSETAPGGSGEQRPEEPTAPEQPRPGDNTSEVREPWSDNILMSD